MVEQMELMAVLVRQCDDRADERGLRRKAVRVQFDDGKALRDHERDERRERHRADFVEVRRDAAIEQRSASRTFRRSALRQRTFMEERVAFVTRDEVIRFVRVHGRGPRLVEHSGRAPRRPAPTELSKPWASTKSNSMVSNGESLTDVAGCFVRAE